MNTETSTGTHKAGEKVLLRLGLVLGVVLLTTALLELALRAFGFTYHLYPTSLEFGYPDKQVLEDFFEQNDEYLWVSGRAAKNIARAREEKPYLLFSGCSCTEWGGFDEALAKRVSEDPELAPLTYGNLASSGWSSYQGLQQMKRLVPELEPKVVTIFYGWDDHWMGFGVDDKTAIELANSSMLKLQELRVVQFATKAMVQFGKDEKRIEGANARPNRVSLPDFRSNLREMVAIARSNNIIPVLITAPSSHVEGEEPQYLEEKFLQDLSRLVPLHRSYVEVVREVAVAENVILCDLAESFEALEREELLTYMLEDGIHFTPEGGAKVGELLFETLREHDLLLKVGQE